MKRYVIRDREAGNVIEECDTFKEAIEIIDKFELQDKIDKIYVPNFYEVYDTVKEEIV